MVRSLGRARWLGLLLGAFGCSAQLVESPSDDFEDAGGEVEGAEDEVEGTARGEVGGSWSEETGDAAGAGGTPVGAGGVLSATGGEPSSGGSGGSVAPGAGGTMDAGGPDPIGDGWTEYFPEWTYHVPPNAEDYGERYTYEDGVFHLWVEDTDLSTFPGNDSGPRSEVRVKNEYSTGERQFQADFMVVAGAERVGIWQLFKIPYPWMIRIYDGKYKQYGNGSTIGDVPFGVWQRFHAVHSTSAQTLKLYIDGVLVLDENIGGSEVDFYNKFGVYGREGMGELNEIYFKNVHYFEKD